MDEKKTVTVHVTPGGGKTKLGWLESTPFLFVDEAHPVVRDASHNPWMQALRGIDPQGIVWNLSGTSKRRGLEVDSIVTVVPRVPLQAQTDHEGGKVIPIERARAKKKGRDGGDK